MLTFVYPWIGWLLPVPLLVRWLVPSRVQEQPAVRVPFMARLQAARGSAADPKVDDTRQPLWLSGFVWLMLLTALARPQWLEPPIERSVPTRDLLLLVDLSGSMDHQDFTNAAGDNVDRLSAAKEVLGDFLARRTGDRVGLVVFGSAPFLQVPFTTDLSLSERLLDETAVGMAGPKTALGDAIGLGIQLFENSAVPTKTIIALTDGNDTDSAVPPGEAARVAKDRDITIHTVAMGDPATVGEEKLDVESLQDVAKTTGGDFFLALNHGELAAIYDRLDAIETREVKTVSHRPRRDLYYGPLVVALLTSLWATVWKLWVRRPTDPSATPTPRLRVNTRTFELEAFQQ